MTDESMAEVYAEHGVVQVTGGVAAGSLPDGVALLEADGSNVLMLSALAGEGQIGVSVSRLEAEPPVDVEWDRVIELSVQTDSGVEFVDSFDGTSLLVIAEAAGSYRLRIAQRVTGEESVEDVQEAPLELMHVTAWPAEMQPSVVLVESDHDTNESDAVPMRHEQAGMEAGRRIGRSIDAIYANTSTLSGDLGEVTVEHDLPVSPRAAFTTLKRLIGFGSAGSEWGLPEDSEGDYPYIVRYEHGGSDPRLNLGIFGTSDRCEVTAVRTDYDRPRGVTFRWTWFFRDPPGSDDTTPVVGTSNVYVSLTPHRTSDGKSHTTVQVVHRHLPLEWASDMGGVWLWQLEGMASSF